MLFFTQIKLVARVLACARAIARIKWKRLIVTPVKTIVSICRKLVECLSTSSKSTWSFTSFLKYYTLEYSILVTESILVYRLRITILLDKGVYGEM